MGDTDGDGASRIGRHGEPGWRRPRPDGAGRAERFMSPNVDPRHGGFRRDPRCAVAADGLWQSHRNDRHLADHAWAWSRLWVRSCGGTGRKFGVSATLARQQVSFDLPAHVTLPFSWQTAFNGAPPAEVEVTVRYLSHRIPENSSEQTMDVYMKPTRGGEAVRARVTRRDPRRDTISFMVPTATAMEIGFGVKW